MKRIAYREWVLEVDPDATREALARAEPMGPATCPCVDCRNFLAARDAGLVYPAEVLRFLSDVGIRVPAETEIAAFGRESSGLHVISGWLHAIGRIAEGPEPRIPAGPDGFTLNMIRLNQSFEIALFEGKALAAKPLREQSLIQIEFLARIPWVIAEPDPELSSVVPVL